jgi:biopolymer transport protein ExbD
MRLAADRSSDDPEIALVPLIDVALTLIIFFVVTTTFEDRAALKVQLPEASVAPTEALKDPLLVVIDDQGRSFVAGNEVLKPDAAALRRAIEQVAGSARDRPVTLRADARAQTQGLITAMDVLGQLGFQQISIATVAVESAP